LSKAQIKAVRDHHRSYGIIARPIQRPRVLQCPLRADSVEKLFNQKKRSKCSNIFLRAHHLTNIVRDFVTWQEDVLMIYPLSLGQGVFQQTVYFVEKLVLDRSVSR